MGIVSSALLGIYISGQVTEALLRGQRPASEAADSREQEAARDDSLPVVLLPTETSLEPGPHCGGCTEGKGVCVCLCVSVRGCWGWGSGWRAELDPSEHKGLLPSASHSPPYKKHGCFSGSFSSASWFTSILLHSCPCQEKHDFGQGCSAISGGTKSVSPALLGGTELPLAATSNNGSATDTVTAAFKFRCWHAACLLLCYCLVDAVWWLHPQKKALGLVCSLSVFNSQPKYQKAMYKIVSLLLPKGVYTLLCFSHEHCFYSMLFD